MRAKDRSVFRATLHAGLPVVTASVLVSAIGIALSAAGAVPIIDLHHNTSNGLPAAPYTIGTPVTISGVVTVGVGTFTDTYTDVWVEDATGGIMLYDPAVLYDFQIGDSVTIGGTIQQYRGMTEIDIDTWTVHASGCEVPEPGIRQCDDVENAFLPDYSEPDEGRLVRLNNVSWTGAWPSFSGGVTLHDESGTCTMYIDGTTGIQGITPPSGPFDVIGVVKQYAGYSPPYTSGYELMPRRPEDIIILPGPQILVGPRETDIQPDRVTIHLETDTETSCWVDYGETTSYELGTASDGSFGQVHDEVLTGLAAATIHHYRVRVTDANGSTTTPDRLFSSGSAPGSTGEIRVAFNKSVDHDLATFEPAAGGQDLQGWLIDRINATNYSIDLAMYSFDLPSVTNALMAAFDRGVRVRFVYDNRSPYQPEVLRLTNHGMVVIDDGFGPLNNGSEIMHHKLWIFDALSSDPSDPWVYTGSWNLSTEQTYTDAQNLIMVQDQALARVATVEFDEMWGSSTLIPNPDNSRFGVNKTDNTPKIFNVGGKEIELYFAPSDPWLGAIIAQVRRADYSMNFCIMSYTRFDLCDEMQARFLGVPNFKVRGVFDSSESGNQYSQYPPMHGDGEYPWNPPADVWLDGETGTLHHKYMIIDVDRNGSDPVVATGSANWSNAAVGENDENVMIVHDARIANDYYQEFAERYHAAGGTDDLSNMGVPPADDLAVFRVWPNPALSQVSAVFALRARGRVTCDLFTVDGRRIERLCDRVFEAGVHALDWEPAGQAALQAGIYYLRLSAPDGVRTRSFTVVR